MTLYHYCSTDAFYKIITTRTIRLSSVTMANDSQEGRLLRKILEDEVQIRDVPMQRINGVLDLLESKYDCLAFCLSERGDQLSQWRGYADDGAGFSIGFDETRLRNIATCESADLRQVIYSRTAQLKLLKPLIQATKKAVKNRPNGGSEDWLLRPVEEFEELDHVVNEAVWYEVYQNLYVLKHSTFAEEKEYRLMRTISAGMTPFWKFRPSRTRIVPYTDIEILKQPRPVVSVHIGPKNETPPYIINDFLRSHGFWRVFVKKSEATYR